MKIAFLSVNASGSYSRLSLAVAGVALLLLSFAAYYGWAEHILLFWDDEEYITGNSWITSPSLDGYIGMFTQVRVFNWHPLTWLSFVPDYYYCGNDAVCYKTTNVVLHGINGFLVFLLSLSVARLLFHGSAANPGLRFAMAFLSASLFVVHPIHAESVMWVSERKDLLYSGFFLASMLSYLSNAARTNDTSPAPFAFFVLALMSKPMAVTLPAVLILFDWLLLRRYEGASLAKIFHLAIIRKLHFFLIAFAVVLVTSLSQVTVGLPQPALDGKIIFVLAGISHYLQAFAYPVSLFPFYPMENVVLELAQAWYAMVAFGLILVLMVLAGAKRAALLLLGFFLVTLSPVSGIVQIGYHAFADRYAYMPTLGFFLAAGLFAEWAYRRFANAKYILPVLSLVVLISLTLETRQYKEVWKNNLGFWQLVEARYPDLSFTVHLNLGAAYKRREDYEKAIIEFSRGIALKPRHSILRVNLANSLTLAGRRDAAVTAFGDIVKAMPENVSSYLTAGDGLVLMGEIEKARPFFLQAAEMEPGMGLVEHRMALVLAYYQQYERALDLLRQLPASGPDWPKTKALISQYENEMEARAERLAPRLETEKN